jgi:hypothetical protein
LALRSADLRLMQLERAELQGPSEDTLTLRAGDADRDGVIVGAGCGFTKGARRGYLFLSTPIELPGPIPTGAACRSLA